MAGTDNLVVLTFEGSETAAAVYGDIEQMEKDKLVQITDAIIIEREDTVGTLSGAGGMSYASHPEGGKPPATVPEDAVRVVQTHRRGGKLAAKGAGIGLLAGFLLGGPIGGLAVGAGLGAITGAMKDFGIDDKNIAAIKARLKPNTSALLVLGHVDNREAFLDKLCTYDPQVVSSTLTPEVEKELRTRLGSA